MSVKVTRIKSPATRQFFSIFVQFDDTKTLHYRPIVKGIYLWWVDSPY